MALPTVVATAIEHFQGGHTPPFIDSNGNVYVLTRVANDRLAMYKATDPTSSFTRQDSAGEPVAGGEIAGLAAVQRGDTLHVVTTNRAGTGGTQYSQFYMSDHATAPDEWSATVNVQLHNPGGNEVDSSADISVDIAVRSDGSVVVVDSLEATGSMHADPSVIKLAYSGTNPLSAANWTTRVAVDSQGTDLSSVSLVLDSSDDKVHIFYTADDGDCFWETFSSGNSLGGTPTQILTAEVAFPGDSRSALCRPIIYTSGADRRIVLLFQINTDDVGSILLTDTGSGFVVDAGGSEVVQTAGAINANFCLAVLGTTVYAHYTKDSNDDLFYRTNADDGGWSSENAAYTGSIFREEGISSAVYVRDGNNRLATTFLDNAGGTGWMYDEVDLGAAGPPPVIPPLIMAPYIPAARR